MDEIRAKWLHFNNELNKINADAQIRAIGKGGEDLLAVHREQNRLFMEACARHKRELDLLAGEKIEPIAHEASAQLVFNPDLFSK